MLLFLRFLKRPLGTSDRSPEETGFTLMELVIVVVIIGILAAIAIPIFSGQQRAAIDATVKKDVETNEGAMAPGLNGRLYVTKERFMSTAVATDKNTIDYVVNNTGNVACQSASRVIATGDVITYHMVSSNGIIKEGVCPDLGSVAPETPAATPANPAPSPTTGGTVGGVTLTQMAGVKFTTTYAPQTNSLNFCYTVNIVIDPDYPHTTPNPSYNWEYKIDLSQPPFWGLNPNANLNSVYGYKEKTLASNLWTVKGEGWNDAVTYANPRVMGFCTTFVPEPPLNTATYTYTIANSSGNNNWWSCVDFTVISPLEYPTPWEITINLDEYFNSINGRTPAFINLNGTKVTGNTYKATGIGWNRYVAKSMARTYSTSICYYPEGNPW